MTSTIAALTEKVRALESSIASLTGDHKKEMAALAVSLKAKSQLIDKLEAKARKNVDSETGEVSYYL